MRILFIILALAVQSLGQSVRITHYGAPDDASGDPLSAAGIGNHNNTLVPLQSAGVTKSYAQSQGLALGQSFSFTATDGTQYNGLIYADTVPDSYQGKTLPPTIDIYDPSSVLGPTNSWSKQLATIDTGPQIIGNGTVTDPSVTDASVQGDGVTGQGNVSISHSQIPPIVQTLLTKFRNVGQRWLPAIQQATSNLFWTLALISLVFTGVWMLLRGAGLLEILAELVRYIVFTGFFWWLLSTGPDLAGKIIASLWQIGGNASGTGNSIFPGDLIALGIQVFQNAITHIVWYEPATIIVPVLIGLIILIALTFVAANVVILLVAAWVVLFAGLIFLGFGGCRWTCDMAINYYRTILGIGISLMTMLLIIGIGIQFMQELVNAAGQTPDVPTMAGLMVAAILLAALAHKLPHMVANIALGSGHTGAVGAMGVLGLFGAMSLIRSIASFASGGASAAARQSATEKLMDRIRVLETANAGNGNGSAQSSAPTQGQRSSSVPVSTNPTRVSNSSLGVSTQTATKDPPPPQQRPVLPDESRGFAPPEDWRGPDEQA